MFRFERDGFLCNRMQDGEACMLEGDGAVFVRFFRTVAFVSDDRATHVGELRANLVVAACLQLDLQQ